MSEYAVDLNATQAAIRAGYSPKAAAETGWDLLRNPQIAQAVATAQAKLAIRTDITQDRVLKELALLAFSDHTHYVIDDFGNVKLAEGAPTGANRAIASLKKRTTTTKSGDVVREVELKFWDKPGPLKLAGRHVGLFPDRVELTGRDGAPLAAPTFYMPDNGRDEPSAPEDAEAPEDMDEDDSSGS